MRAAGVAREERIRGVVPHTAVGPLLDREVAEPVEREAGDVVQERCAREEHLPVARPPRALALRTVGRDRARVVAEAPVGDLVEAVDALVAAPEPARAAEVGVHDDARDVVGGEPVRVSFDPDVLEAVRRVSRFEPIALATRRHHVIDLADRQRAAVGVVATGEMVLRDVARRRRALRRARASAPCRPVRGR